MITTTLIADNFFADRLSLFDFKHDSMYFVAPTTTFLMEF
jgi:hypothetical protein